MSQAQLSPAQRELHAKAVNFCAEHRRLEAEIIELLLAIEADKIHRLLGHSSLFTYAVFGLGLSEANAYAFISVARKCRDCELLRRAIEERTLSVSKAARLVSALVADNAESLLAFATTHSSREIDREVARLNPKAKAKDSVKPLSKDWEQLSCAISPEALARLKRAQSVLSSKLGRPADFNETLVHSLGEYLQKHDPVMRAQRAQKRKQAKKAAPAKMESAKAESASKVEPAGGSKFCPSRVNNQRRSPFRAAEKHAANARDGGRCTFVDPVTGKRCENDRWLHLHHVVAVAQGGGNHADNLRTLCAFHHDLTHQLSLPLDGQVTWLKEKQVRYG